MSPTARGRQIETFIARLLLLLALASVAAHGWTPEGSYHQAAKPPTPPSAPAAPPLPPGATPDLRVSRRAALRHAAHHAASAGCLLCLAEPQPGHAAADGSSSLDQARAQLAASDVALADLLTRFDDVDGDGVRRVLGTVGTSSPLYKIERAARLVALESSAEPDAALEEVDTLVGLIFNAEGDAYSSLWVPTGGGTTPQYWLGRSKKEVVKARQSLRRLIELDQ